MIDVTVGELLLTAGATVEKVHQAAWLVLLRDSEFLAKLGVDLGTPRTVRWEPDGGTFDLKIEGPETSAWIELKVDSDLGDGQIDRQREHGAQGHVVYALLGLAWARSRPWKVKRATAGGARVFGPNEVISALIQVQRARDVAPGVAELARSYAGVIDDLRRRGEDFRTIDADSWSLAHSA